jgi:Ca-activated chloride channel family protein
VYTVGFGTADGELIPLEGGGFVKDRAGQVVKSRLDEETLQQVAVDTGGVYLHATGPSLGLADLYRDHIDTLEKREVATTLERRYEHRFQFPLLLAFALLLLEPLIGDRRAPVERRRWLPFRRATTPRPSATASLVVAALAVTQLAWLDPHHRAREGNRLYDAGKYDEAATRYNEALVDEPDSPLLHFNLGDAAYKQGKYDEALKAFQQVPGGDENRARTARAAYNVGNTKYRLGEAAESSDPKAALGLWAEALAFYRRALGADPNDEDARVNHELVERKIAELRKKLEEQQKREEEQKKQQEQQQQEQQEQEQQQQQQGDEQKQDQEQQEQEPQAQPEEQQPEEEKADEQDAGQQTEPPEAQPPAPQAGEAQAGADEGKQEDLSRQEAAALLDAQRSEEIRPDEVVRKLQGAGVAEPRQDW